MNREISGTYLSEKANIKNCILGKGRTTDRATKIKKDFKLNWQVYLILLPVLAYYLIFCYRPIYGAVIAFQKFSPAKGIWGSTWIGFDNFIQFFQGRFFWRLLKNTLSISFHSILWGFPAPIIFALLLNEIKSRNFSRVVQTVTYMPHFISLVVMCGIVKEFVSDTGIITQLFRAFGYSNGQMLNEPNLFLPIYVISGIWQEVGWGSIIYISAIMGVDKELYEAAYLDGAGRLRQVFSVTLPSIMPIIVTMFVLRLGNVMNVGFEKIILLYNPITRETADVISSYVYRVGLMDFQYGYSTAVGLFNSVINFGFVLFANAITARVNGTSLW